MTPYIIPADGIASIWDSVSGFLEDGLKTAHGEMTIDQLHLLLLQGRTHLVVGYDDKDKIAGALAYELKDYPNFRVGYVLSVGGKGVIESKEGYENFKAHLKERGCKHIEGWCTPNTARLWQRIGFKPVYSIMRQDL